MAACYNNPECEDTNFSIHWIAIPEFHNKRKWKLSQEHISCYACSHLLYGRSSLIWFPSTTFPTKWWSPTFITISKHHHHPNHKGCRKHPLSSPEHLLTQHQHLDPAVLLQTSDRVFACRIMSWPSDFNTVHRYVKTKLFWTCIKKMESAHARKESKYRPCFFVDFFGKPAPPT